MNTVICTDYGKPKRRIVVKHITDGNDIEGEVVGAMGGKVIELASDRIRREVMEEANAELEEANAELEEANAELEEANAELEKWKAELEKWKAELEKWKAEREKAKAKAEKYKRILIENGIEID